MLANGPVGPSGRTAILRPGLSRPVRLALRDGLISRKSSVFDYGCGRGRDVRLLRDSGVSCLGWDPHYFPATGLQPADVVNLGYVINVVERPAERAATLRAAWALCRKALIVSARTTPPDDPTKYAPHGDGVLTSRGTFQKFFRPGELRDYIESTLDREAVPVERGVHYVFRERRGLLPVGVKVGGVS